MLLESPDTSPSWTCHEVASRPVSKVVITSSTPQAPPYSTGHRRPSDVNATLSNSLLHYACTWTWPTQLRSVERLSLPARPLSLRIGRELDRGAWGTVHEGDLDGVSVAVKKIHELLKDAPGSYVFESFSEECERLRTLFHPHVIEFLSAYRDAELGPILVMEKMKENLRQFLENEQKLSIQEQIRISHEITQGVAFLHQLNPPMVHSDLNDKNVMFTFDGVVKIGDFGQSRLMKDAYLTSTAPGMLSFMPPECQKEDGNKYDESLDVFSLGVLMLEIGTQRLPFANVFGIGVIPEVDRRGKDLQRMSDLHPLKPFILLCLSDDQKKRPKATELQMVLPRLKENVLQTMLATEHRLRAMENIERQLQRRNHRAVAAHQKMQRRLASMLEQEQKMMTDLQVAEQRSRNATEENQRIHMELDHVKALLKQSEERNRELEAQNQMLYEQFASLQTYTKMQDPCTTDDVRFVRVNCKQLLSTFQLWKRRSKVPT